MSDDFFFQFLLYMRVLLGEILPTIRLTIPVLVYNLFLRSE